MIEEKPNYVASCIRKKMRINVKKEDKFIYKLAKIAKECFEYGEWGVDLVWDYKKFCYVTSSKIDMFNTACQIGVNMLGPFKGKKVTTNFIKEAVELVYKVGKNKHGFSMPKTKDVIEAMLHGIYLPALIEKIVK